MWQKKFFLLAAQVLLKEHQKILWNLSGCLSPCQEQQLVETLSFLVLRPASPKHLTILFSAVKGNCSSLCSLLRQCKGQDNPLSLLNAPFHLVGDNCIVRGLAQWDTVTV